MESYRTMEIQEQVFCIGQVVLAKLKGYAPWPATIIEMQKKNIVKVVFFGCNNQWALVGFKKLTPILAAQKIIDKHFEKNKMFAKAVKEMEFILRKVQKTTDPPKITVPSKNETLQDKLIECRKLSVIVHRLTPEEIASFCAVKKNKKSKLKRAKLF